MFYNLTIENKFSCLTQKFLLNSLSCTSSKFCLAFHNMSFWFANAFQLVTFALAVIGLTYTSIICSPSQLTNATNVMYVMTLFNNTIYVIRVGNKNNPDGIHPDFSRPVFFNLNLNLFPSHRNLKLYLWQDMVSGQLLLFPRPMLKLSSHCRKLYYV